VSPGEKNAALNAEPLGAIQQDTGFAESADMSSQKEREKMAPEELPEDVFAGISQSLRYGYKLASWVPEYLRNFADRIEDGSPTDGGNDE